MKLHRIMDPKSIDEPVIARLLAADASTVIVQFSQESAYNISMLENLNGACRNFGSKVNARFWGHYRKGFDCTYLRHIPEVRSLNLDCLDGISNYCRIGVASQLGRVRLWRIRVRSTRSIAD